MTAKWPEQLSDGLDTGYCNKAVSKALILAMDLRANSPGSSRLNHISARSTTLSSNAHRRLPSRNTQLRHGCGAAESSGLMTCCFDNDQRDLLFCACGSHSFLGLRGDDFKWTADPSNRRREART